MRLENGPKVSIIVPTYNRAEDLKRAIDSVLAQTFKDWEMVIVDNHSNDHTDEVIKNYHDERLKLFKIHNEGIIAASRNMAIKESLGEYLAFLDSDDWWLPTKLEESMDYLEKGIDFVYHELYLVKSSDQNKYSQVALTRDVGDKVFENLLIHGNGINNSSVVVRKKYIEAVGGLNTDPHFVAAEDYDTWLRVSRLTSNFKFINKPLGFYWAGGGNITNPTRLFCYINAFNVRYQDDIKKLKLEKKVYWTSYASGRAHFLLGNFDQAYLKLKEVESLDVPLFIFLKTKIMLGQIFFKDFKKKFGL